MEDYMIRIMKRYAAPKILWQIGTAEAPPSPEALKEWAATLKLIRPDEDWVAPFTNNAKTIETNLTARFEEYVSHFQGQVIAGLQNPNLVLSLLVLRVSDASARAMLDAWNRKIGAIQDAIKEMWEDFIFKPLVVQAGIDESQTPELIWGKPEVISTTPKTQIDQLTLLLNPTLVAMTPETRFDLENQLREAMGLEQLPKEMRPVAAAAVTQTLGQPAGLQPLPASTYAPPAKGKKKPTAAGEEAAQAAQNRQDAQAARAAADEQGSGSGSYQNALSGKDQKAIARKVRELERDDRKR